jgi:hypothetical protein
MFLRVLWVLEASLTAGSGLGGTGEREGVPVGKDNLSEKCEELLHREVTKRSVGNHAKDLQRASD